MSEENNNKKTNFFKEALKSVKDLEKYEDFALEQPAKAFKYLLKLVAIFCLIICVFYTYQIVQNMNDIYANLKDKLPEFSYADGTLTIDSEEPVVIEEYKESLGKIIIDTNISDNETNKYDEEIEDGQLGILVLKDKCVILSNGTMGQVTYKYTDLASAYNVTEFTKQDIVNYIDGMNVVSIYGSIYFVIFIYLFIAYFISILLDVLLLAVLAYIVSRISSMRLKFAPSFSIAVHGITLPVILNLIYIIVNLFTGFTIKYFQLMYSTISYIYVIVAILMIKTDFINRQMELIKLEQEREKVKEELKQKEEELKKEKEKQENKKPKKEDKEKQEEKTDKRKKKEDKEDSEGAGAHACKELGK